MHQDYKTRLATLSDKLTDAVLEEADPENWAGGNKRIGELTKQERGDRYWDKKNAAASLTLLIKVHSLIGMQTRGGTPSDNPDTNDEAFALGQQVSKAEREAAAIIERLQKGKK
ncbi:hypothetical protein HJ49_002089 [Salmonella enterica subsp. enterica]|nr:hypothetical protein [Salmonella enterica]EDW0015767.1 hypothetical protein [Salmonella enterica subsp. enterica serovar Aba]EIH3063397.1 hypothetical protein [Salmonella enterica subsp. enterica serovar Sandiego]EKI2415794.1 hypothetical protein [Salmonella enterica]HCZ4730138.1 hypothetical protein [Salmonella enterica subsp. enterica serovar Saintpaul str. CFSAN004137]